VGNHVTGCWAITQEIRQSENGKAGQMDWEKRGGVTAATCERRVAYPFLPALDGKSWRRGLDF